MADLCIVCVQDTNNKPKPGILPCLGCKQVFCTRHVVAHRQELANELDLVISERNELQDALDRPEDLVDVSTQINIIDEWMKRTIEQVYQVADDARQQVVSQAEEHKKNIKHQFTELSSQLGILRDNESFYEQDIENMKEKCIHLKAILKQVNINVDVADVLPSLIQGITLKKTGRNEEAVVEQTSVEPLSIVEKESDEPLSVVENLVKYQKPFKQIKLPHTGSLYVGNNIALLGDNTDYTLIDLETGSFRSISIDNLSSPIFAWSTYLNGFLCVKSDRKPEIVVIKREKQRMIQNQQTFAANGHIKCMACFADRLLLVHYNGGVEIIEEWCLKTCFVERRTYGTLVSPINHWRPPLICEKNETINTISFNAVHIVSSIRNETNCDKNRIEFRTRDMRVVGNLILKDYTDTSLLYLHTMNDGWLLGHKTDHSKPWYYTLIDEYVKAYEQKFLSAQNIKSIEVVDCAGDKILFAICRKDNDTSTLASALQRCTLDLYKT